MSNHVNFIKVMYFNFEKKKICKTFGLELSPLLGVNVRLPVCFCFFAHRKRINIPVAISYRKY